MLVGKEILFFIIQADILGHRMLETEMNSL